MILVALCSACVSVNDCECQAEEGAKKTVFEHYDYEGSCSELNEDGVKCVAK